MSDAAAPTLTNAPFALPKALRELLRRDVALEISHQRLSSALAEIEQEADTLQKTRPPFMFLQPKATRSTYNRQLLGASESLNAITDGLEKLERVRPVLHAWVEDELETHLRNSDPAYISGLATHRWPEDWERWSLRLAARIRRLTEFLQALTTEFARLPVLMMVDEDERALDVFNRTARVAAAVDAEVHFLNRVADTQRRMLSLGDETLKRQALLGCEAGIQRLRAFPAGQAVKVLADFMGNHLLAFQQVRGAIVAEGALAIAAPGTPRGYVLRQWESLRKLVRLDLDPDSIDQLVADTERLLEGHL
ncbi:MAG: hypothetical protein ABII82_05550 [Verrucomicrobiota bacterium]